MTQLQALDLRHNHLDHGGHTFLADALLSALGGLRKLRSVRVSNKQGVTDPNVLQGALPHVRVN